MSLKAFHVIFISAASAMVFGFGIWELKEYFSGAGQVWDLVFGIGGLAVGVGLIVYERYFLKKLRPVSYL